MRKWWNLHAECGLRFFLFYDDKASEAIQFSSIKSVPLFIHLDARYFERQMWTELINFIGCMCVCVLCVCGCARESRNSTNANNQFRLIGVHWNWLVLHFINFYGIFVRLQLPVPFLFVRQCDPFTTLKMRQHVFARSHIGWLYNGFCFVFWTFCERNSGDCLSPLSLGVRVRFDVVINRLRIEQLRWIDAIDVVRPSQLLQINNSHFSIKPVRVAITIFSKFCTISNLNGTGWVTTDTDVGKTIITMTRI